MPDRLHLFSHLMRRLMLCIALLLPPVSHGAPAGDIEFEIAGLDSALEDNVRLFLQTVPPPRGDSLGAYKKQLLKQAGEALKPLGYYQPQITLDSRRADDELTIALDITAGPQILIGAIDVRLHGDADRDPAFAALLAEQTLAPGMPLLHSDYEALKSALISLALERGYFDSQWRRHAIEVSLQQHRATLVLHLDAGQRYHFGPIKVIETGIDGASDAEYLVLSMATFDEGEPFEANRLAEYNLALSSSQYFSRIQILPRQQQHNGHRLPIDVQVTKKPANSVELGGGVSSNVGVRGRVKWNKPWINKYGHSIGSELDLSGKKQAISASYKIPIEDPIDNYARIVTGWQRINNEDTDSRKLTLQLQRQWLLASDWKRTAFVKFEQEDFRQGSESAQQTNMIINGVSYARTRARGGLNLNWGDRQQMSLELSHSAWGSDVDLAKFRLQSKWLRTFNDTHRIIAKADLGAILVDDITSVPASMRFFSGGDDNLRGFEFETVSPVDDQGEDSGGLYLATSSVEYSYPVADKWRLATFVDIGTATNDFSEDLNVDTGFGVRWQTPVGPLRVDLAFPVAHAKDDVKDVRLSFSIGPEL